MEKYKYVIAFTLSVLAYTACAVVATAASATGGAAVGVNTGATVGVPGVSAANPNAGANRAANINSTNSVNTRQNFRYQNTSAGVMGSQAGSDVTIDETGRSNTTVKPATTQQAKPVRIDETGRVNAQGSTGTTTRSNVNNQPQRIILDPRQQ